MPRDRVNILTRAELTRFIGRNKLDVCESLLLMTVCNARADTEASARLIERKAITPTSRIFLLLNTLYTAQKIL